MAPAPDDISYPARANQTSDGGSSGGNNNGGDITYPARGGNASAPTSNDPTRGSAQHATAASNSSGGSIAGIIIGLLIVIAIISLLGWLFYRHYRARKAGLPSPGMNPFSDRNRVSGSSGGPLGWLKGQFATMSRGRKAGGAYEGTSAAAGNFGAAAGPTRSGRASGFRGLDPDEAWDERVGNEADYGYDETELQLRGQPPRGLSGHSQLDLQDTSYGGASYGPLGGQGTGHSRTELDDRYDEEMGGKPRADPFADPEPSLRSISPNPTGHGGRLSEESARDQRRSAFREGNMS